MPIHFMHFSYTIYALSMEYVCRPKITIQVIYKTRSALLNKRYFNFVHFSFKTKTFTN